MAEEKIHVHYDEERSNEVYDAIDVITSYMKDKYYKMNKTSHGKWRDVIDDITRTFDEAMKQDESINEAARLRREHEEWLKETEKSASKKGK